MPHDGAVGAYGEFASAPDCLSDSRAGDENCAAGDGFVPASAPHWNQQVFESWFFRLPCG